MSENLKDSLQLFDKEIDEQKIKTKFDELQRRMLNETKIKSSYLYKKRYMKRLVINKF